MDQIANYMLTVPIEKNMNFTIFFILINLFLYYDFQVLGFFSTKSCSSKN
jgi:hypothetical protein